MGPKKRKRPVCQGPANTLMTFGITNLKRSKGNCNENLNEDSILKSVIEISAQESSIQCAKNYSFYQRLRQNIKSLKMHIRKEVPGDGNCFFSCVSDQLDRLNLQPRNHAELRSDLICSLQSLESDDPLSDLCSPEYLTALSKSGTWADAVAIRGIARLLGRDIHIVTSQENSTQLGYLGNKILASTSAENQISQTPLLLGHIGEQHYVSLDQGVDAESIYDIRTQTSTEFTKELETTELSILEPEVAGSTTLEPKVAGSSALEPEVAGSAALEPKVDGSTALEPEVAGSSGLESEVAGSSGLEPQVSGSAALEPEVDGSATIDPKVTGSATIEPEVSSVLEPEVTGSAALEPEVAGSSGLEPEVTGSATLEPEAAGSSGPEKEAFGSSSQESEAETSFNPSDVPVTLVDDRPPGHVADSIELPLADHDATIPTVTQYDVGDIVQGTVHREDLDNCMKANYLLHHFTPCSNYKSFVKHTVVRGKNKQKKVLVFQQSWLHKYGWLVYSPAAGGGLCKYCTLFASSKDKRKFVGALVTKPFVTFNKATGKDGVLDSHHNLQYHKDAVQTGLLLIQQQSNPETSLPYKISQANKQMYQKNIHILKAIVEAVVLCGKQNLPLRGHRDDNTSTSSNMGNFLAILEMIAKRDDILREHIDNGKRNAQYTSKVIQNEIIDVVGEYIRKRNTQSLDDDNAFFSIMADEVTDPHGNQEILSVCLRMLSGYKIREFFFDFVYLERATGETIANAIVNSLKAHNINISNARGQSYDGASCMSSDKVGVQARIRQMSPRALYVHCNSHVLNLSIAGACKLPVIRNMIDTLNAVFLFFDLSPKRQRFLERILDHFAPDMKKKKLVGLCKTRWVERHTCYEVFYDMYEFLCECLEAILDPSQYPQICDGTWTGNWDQETRTKSQGLLKSLESPQTIIAFIVAKNVLENIRPMASKLQKRDFDIYQAYGMIDQTRQRIDFMRSEIEEEYGVWFEDATRLATLLGTSISAPRTPNSNRQIHRANAPSTSPKEYYLRNLAIPFCDHLSTEYGNRFNPDNRKGVQILELLPTVITKAESVNNVVDRLMYWEHDLPHVPALRAEVIEWQRYWRDREPISSSASPNLSECLAHADVDIFPNIRTLLSIGCVLPVGSCEAERSFSCLRRIKTYLRNRMGGDRLAGLTLMSMNHDMDIDMDKICNMFIARNKRKMFSSCILYQ